MLGDFPVDVVLLAIGLKTVDGVAEVPFGLMAWFIDPGKNCVGIIQLK